MHRSWHKTGDNKDESCDKGMQASKFRFFYFAYGSTLLCRRRNQCVDREKQYTYIPKGEQ